MTLSIQRSDRRDRRLCRFGVMLVVCSLVINMVAVPKAQAVVTETAALGAAATVCVVDYSTAALLVSGMKTGAVTSSVIGMMDSYAVATGVAASGTALASTIATGILVAGGTLLVGAAAAALIAGFIDWLREEKGVVSGAPDFPLSDSGLLLTNGSCVPYVPFGSDNTYYSDSDEYCIFSGHAGSDPSAEATYEFANGYSVRFYVKTINKMLINYYEVTRPDGTYSSYGGLDYSYAFGVYNNAIVISHYQHNWDPPAYTFNRYSYPNDGTLKLSDSDIVSGSAVLSPNEEMITLPSEIPEGLVLSIDTGLNTLPQGDPQAAADAIMQSAIAGSLAPSVNVAPDPSVQPDPDPEPDPNPDPDPEVPTEAPELPSNIGRLGKALTTRFPFSIPWDIAKAVKLLAAPAQAPYWEIDFMRPIAYRFGSLGDTTITIDLGKPEYEIIGITTRLTSTIGFCLALAAATKRFIWTA